MTLEIKNLTSIIKVHIVLNPIFIFKSFNGIGRDINILKH